MLPIQSGCWMQRAADVSHVLYVSIVGIERHPFAYYQMKLKAEALVQQSGIPWSIQRAMQFYSFIDLILRAFVHWPVALLPIWFYRTIGDFGVFNQHDEGDSRRMTMIWEIDPTHSQVSFAIRLMSLATTHNRRE
jgi:hypothetical protein